MHKPRKCCPRCLVGSIVYLFGFLVVLFIVAFLIGPVVFKYSTEIQRAAIFPTWEADPANFSDIKSFGLSGVKNLYVTVNETDNITLGIWQILPDELLSEFIDNDQYNYEAILANKKYDILIYLHGNGGVRSNPLELYGILRKYFHIIAVDYRGYGDSSKAEINEENIVQDTVNLFNWLKNHTEARIFFWGHSLGTGVSTHTIANLKVQGQVPAGLVLETPFTAVTDVMESSYTIVKIFSWLPWYRSTMLDPINYNGFGFNSTKYIVDVDCPIMILHAKDDTVIPHELAEKLYLTAVKNRNESQGNVTFHLFEAKGYDHMWLYLAPELPQYTSAFIDECKTFEKEHKLM